MIDLLLGVVGVALVFAVLAPLLSAGGQLIAACMAQQQVLAHALATALQLAMLFLVGLMGVGMTQRLAAEDQTLGRMAVLIALLITAYGVRFFVQRVVLKTPRINTENP